MICNHDTSEVILETNTHQLYRCSSCELIVSRKKSIAEDNSCDVYKNYYKPDKASRFFSPIELIVKIFRFFRARKIASINKQANSILDIGSGRGWTLYFLKKYFNYTVTAGTQISKPAYEFSKDKLKLEIYNQDLLDISFEKTFDIVSILHVLEHVKNPEEYIEKIYKLLNHQGILYIEVPNYDSWSRKMSGKHWLALDLKHHLFFFRPSSLESLLHKYNFKINKIRSFSLEYSAFTSTQSLVNLITNSDSYLFGFLQEGKFKFKVIFHFFLFGLLFIPCLLVNLCLYFSKNGEVITIIAQKNDN
jgi:2-polyprenyl-3-methyl-5-hydroxy-6-metoxy-1,4-benzoquinol methylase